MAQKFSINGYYKDDKTPFEGYIVKSTHDVIEDEDDSIFYYGLDEVAIKAAIEAGENTCEDFVITSYEPI
jgi:hypothetical protein